MTRNNNHNNNNNRRKRHISNKNMSKLKNKTKKIKSIEFNKYEGSKNSMRFKYVKMPYLNTSVVDSKNLLIPLKYIDTNKESIDTEKSVSYILETIKRDEKINKLDARKDYYTYINYSWMKEQDVKLNYEKYYFVKLDSFRFVQDTVNNRVIQLANDYYKNNKTADAKKVENIMKSMDRKNFTYDKIKKHIDIMINDYEKYVNNDDLIGYLSNVNRCEIISWGCPINWSTYQDEKDAVNIRSHIQSPGLSFYDYDKLYIIKIVIFFSFSLTMVIKF